VEIDIVDVTLAEGDDGEARLNLGDSATGAGFAASATAWSAGDGFIGVPNAPSAGGAAAQALMLTQGNTRLALAIRDTRWDGAAGALAKGDRAVVSDCDAALHLDQSANTIALRSTDCSVVVDGDGGAVTLTRGSNTITIDDSHLRAEWGSGAVNISSSSLSLSFGPLLLVLSGTTVSIATSSGPPASVTINGVPLTVP